MVRKLKAPYCFNHYNPKLHELSIIQTERLFNSEFNDLVEYGTKVAEKLLLQENKPQGRLEKTL